MTKFADQLFDDLMREHGPALAHVTPPAPRPDRATARRAVLAAGGGLVAAGAVAGTLVATGAASGEPSHSPAAGTPAYAVTKNPDGTISLAVYQESGYAQVNAWLRQHGEKQVVVVPIRPGCPRPRKPVVSGRGRTIGTSIGRSPTGSVTVSAHGIPAGDILVLGLATTGHASVGVGKLTSPPAPSCVNAPAPPSGNGGSDS
jgi:hypothetical protein